MNYSNHDEIDELTQEYIKVVTQQDDIKKVSIMDINGFLSMLLQPEDSSMISNNTNKKDES